MDLGQDWHRLSPSSSRATPCGKQGQSLGAEGYQPHSSDEGNEAPKEDLSKVTSSEDQTQVPPSLIEGHTLFCHILLSPWQFQQPPRVAGPSGLRFPETGLLLAIQKDWASSPQSTLKNQNQAGVPKANSILLSHRSRCSLWGYDPTGVRWGW